MEFIDKFFFQFSYSLNAINRKKIKSIIDQIRNVKAKKGRIFFIGSGGGAGHANHAVNDFRKLCNIESYSPSDNTSELTARINDEGWRTSYSEYLKVSKFSKKDSLFIFSVGGGSVAKNISMNIVECIRLAHKKKAKIFGVVGSKKGYINKYSDLVINIDVKDKSLITPIVESLQAYIWHLIVSEKTIKENKTKW